MEKSVRKVKKTTIYDIAAKVGTSTATVSRVLSKSGYPVRDEMRNKIMETAKEMNYSPNMIGRMLKKSESKDIGVIIPTILNPFYPQIVLGIELEARQRGYNIFLCNSFRDTETERKYIESLYQKQVSGIIISSIGDNLEYLKELQSTGVKIVVFDQDIQDLECSKVCFDYIRGGLLAVEYLINMGHQNIAFLTSPLTRRSRKETLEGYKLALLKNDLVYKENNVLVSEHEEETINGNYEFENGKMLAQKFLELEDRPTAIFAVNDMTAFGIIQKLISRGVRIPEDVSVIGFDNIEVSSMVNPPLTTVDQPSFETGRLASKMLLESMGDDNYKNVSVILEPTLIIRNSVKEIT